MESACAIEVEMFGRDLWQDPDTGLLWIVRTLADPPGSDPYPPLEPGTPLIGDDYSPARIAGLTVDVLTVLDPALGEVLLHHRLDQSATAEQFLSDGRLVRTGEDDDGHVWLEILTLDLVR